MFKPYKTEFNFTKEDKEKMIWAEWAFQSHNWVETYPGYYECQLCGTRQTNVSGLSFETVTFCPENPIFKRELLKRGVK